MHPERGSTMLESMRDTDSMWKEGMIRNRLRWERSMTRQRDPPFFLTIVVCYTWGFDKTLQNTASHNYFQLKMS